MQRPESYYLPHPKCLHVRDKDSRLYITYEVATQDEHMGFQAGMKDFLEKNNSIIVQEYNYPGTYLNDQMIVAEVVDQQAYRLGLSNASNICFVLPIFSSSSTPTISRDMGTDRVD